MARAVWAVVVAGVVGSGCASAGLVTGTPVGSTSSASTGAPLAAVASSGTPSSEPEIALPPEQKSYRDALLALSKCKIQAPTLVVMSLDAKCPELDAFKALTKDTTLKRDERGAIARGLLGAESPEVRLAALSENDASPGDERFALLFERTKVETHPTVMLGLAHYLFLSVESHPELAGFFIGLTKHADAKVRYASADFLSWYREKKVPGFLERTIALIEKDPDDEVRIQACQSAGGHADDALVPVLSKLAGATSTPGRLAKACFSGLRQLWYDTPWLWHGRSQLAYEETLKLLDDTPRPSPIFEDVWSLAGAHKDDGSAEDDFIKWRSYAKWFDPARLRKTLASILLDEAASTSVRASAVRAAFAHGASKADLQGWKKAIKPERKDVIAAIDKALSGKL